MMHNPQRSRFQDPLRRGRQAAKVTGVLTSGWIEGRQTLPATKGLTKL